MEVTSLNWVSDRALELGSGGAPMVLYSCLFE